MKKLIPLFTFTSRLHLLFIFVLLPLFANAETYNLIGQRHLRLYTAPEPTQSYNASIDAQTVADSLCNFPWTRATSAEATSTSHAGEQLDANVRNRDRFDAALFCAFHTNGLHTAFANAAVYRYKLPDGQLPNLTSLGVKVSSDPYNALGARIVLMASDTPDIPTDCSIVRGESGTGIKLSGIAPRITRTIDGKDYWYPASTNAVFGSQVLPAGGLQLRRYLFVFVLMENYSTSRGNWLEGCAWIDNLVSVSTDAPVPGWSDGQTVDLSGEIEDGPTVDGIRADKDNDGLTDFRERLASTVLTNLYGTTPVDQTKMMTYPGQLVPDYFLPVSSGSSGNWTYLGSLLTDHDFIEDWLEDSDELFSGDRKASRYQYDANLDTDGNGWDNWSEARAFLATDSYCGHPTPKGRIKVVYNGNRSWTGNLVIRAYGRRDGSDLQFSVVEDEKWTVPVGGRSAWYDIRVSSGSYLRRGKCMFAVYNDEDRSGTWTAGEPFGVVTDVEVGYDSIEDSTVELTDIRWAGFRLELGKAVYKSGFGAQTLMSDRGVNGSRYYPNDPSTNSPHSQLAYRPIDSYIKNIRIRLVRLSINSVTSWPSRGRYAMTILMDKPLTKIYDNMVFDEVSLLLDGKFEPSWGTLQQAWADIGFPSTPQDIANVSYGFAIGPGELSPIDPSQNNFLDVVFNLAYEPLTAQTKAVPVGALDSEHDARPTFRWTHENTIGKDYPAFRLRVYRAASNALVFDSGDRNAPARDRNGVYVWQAPICVGMKTSSGQVFDNGDYYFTVSMLDAKFTTPNTGEQQFAFTMNANYGGGDVSDRYSIQTAVKYFGHVSTADKTIRVEAFESPDFIGIPASATTVTNTSPIAAIDSIVPNAQLVGLKSGTEYFVRAFVDVDGDGILDQGEPWGYCNYVGEASRKDIYTPRPFSFGVGTTEMPTAVVYIEDSDVAPLDLSTIVTED